MLFLTGANDPRVDPMQLAQDDGAPAGGDGIGPAGPAAHQRQQPATASARALRERIEEIVDVYAFLFDAARREDQPVP